MGGSDDLGRIFMIDVSTYKQNAAVNSEVEVLFSVTIPILKGILYSLKRDIVQEVGDMIKSHWHYYLDYIEKVMAIAEYVLNMLCIMQLYIITQTCWKE